MKDDYGPEIMVDHNKACGRNFAIKQTVKAVML